MTTPSAIRTRLLGCRLPFIPLLIVAACTTSEAPPGPAVRLEVAGLASPMPAGVAAFTVTAKDASDHTATGYTGTVHFKATDSAAVLPPDYTFVGADAGTHTFKLTFETLGSQVVTGLRFVQTTTLAPPLPPQPAPPDPAELAAVDAAVAGVPQGDLRAALTALGRAMLSGDSPSRQAMSKRQARS